MSFVTAEAKKTKSCVIIDTSKEMREAKSLTAAERKIIMTNTAVIDMREPHTGMKRKQKKQKVKNPRKEAIKLILALTFLMFAFSVAVVIFAEVFHLDLGDYNNNLAYLVGELGVGLTALTCMLAAKKDTGKGLGTMVKLKGFDWSIPLVLTVFSWVAGEVCDHISGSVLSNFMTITPNEDSPVTAVTVICSVLLAPLFEEVIFRYSFMGILKDRFGKAFTIIFPAIIFAAVHLYNLQGFGNVLIGTLVAATIYYHTGNILYVMLEHAIHNALCIIDFSKLTIFGTPLYHERSGFILAGTPYFILNIVLLTLCIIWFVKYFRPRYCLTQSE